ncbi:hypothetical protein [Streptosporangium sp. NPDC003464]
MAELLTPIERRHYLNSLSDHDCRMALAYLAGRMPEMFDLLASEYPVDQITKGSEG